MRTHSLLAAAGCGFFVSMSAAGIPVYTDEAIFLADLISPSVTEGYEGYADDLADGARTVELDYFDMSYNGFSTFGVGSEVDIPNGVQPIEGDKHVRVNYGGGGQVTISFEFDSPIEAFGTYYSDVELSSLSVMVFLDNGQSFNAGNLSTTGNGQAGYFGIQPIEAGIESVAFTMSAHTGHDGVFFDQTTVSVPTPAAVSLLTIAGIGSVRRKR